MAGRKLPWWKPTAKTALHAAFAAPLAALALRGFIGDLGVNPIETAIRNEGDWALRFLIVALAVTPLRVLAARPDFARYRRLIGLWAFAYVCLHLLTYVGVDQTFDWREIWKAILKNKFITVGMAAFALLLPLAITSTAGMVRRLGFARWKKLHRAVYVAGLCGCVHYIWMVKADIRQPLVYLAVVLVLLGLRAVWWAEARNKARAASAPVAAPAAARQAGRAG